MGRGLAGWVKEAEEEEEEEARAWEAGCLACGKLGSLVCGRPGDVSARQALWRTGKMRLLERWLRRLGMTRWVGRVSPSAERGGWLTDSVCPVAAGRVERRQWRGQISVGAEGW